MKTSSKLSLGLLSVACIFGLANRNSAVFSVGSATSQGNLGRAPYLITAAYPFWQAPAYPPKAIPLELLHEVGHSFILPGPNGTLDIPDGFLMPELIARVHAANRKITVGVGGASSHDEFASMAADPGNRAAFVQNLTDFVVQQGYDGVVIDWEFPQTSSESQHLNALMAMLRASLDATGQDLRLDIAVSSGDWYGRWIDTAAITPLVDYYLVMTFSFHGGWSDQSGHNAPLYPPPPSIDRMGSVNDSIKYWAETRGVPYSQILLGLAFFGISFNSEDLYQPFTSSGQADYSAIKPLIGDGYTRHWDSICQVPYLTQDLGPMLWSYDDGSSIGLKCDYVIENRLAGVAIWDVSMDLIDGQQELLEIVGDRCTLPPPTYSSVYLPAILR